MLTDGRTTICGSDTCVPLSPAVHVHDLLLQLLMVVVVVVLTTNHRERGERATTRYLSAATAFEINE